MLNRLHTVRKLFSSRLETLRTWHRKAFSYKYLLLTNVSISLASSCTGDALQQRYERYYEGMSHWDPRRTYHMGISAIGVGAICHYWYLFLDRRMPGHTLSIVVKKIFLDQIICSPMYITAFFVTMGLIEHKNTQEVANEMGKKFWKLYAAEWMVWPVAQFVNFSFLPTRYRVFYDNIISLGYDIYTSKVKHSDD